MHLGGSAGKKYRAHTNRQGRRSQRMRVQGSCSDSGVTVDTSTNAPQQNGVSERDVRTKITRYR